MRVIKLKEITRITKESFLDINFNVSKGIESIIRKSKESEDSELAKNVLGQIIDNHKIAKEKMMPLCQDTGMAIIFMEIGKDVTYDGDIYEALNEGVRQAYKEGFLRKSVVNNPIERKNTQDNTPAIIHTKIVQGDKIKLTFSSKGAGSENMSLVKMLTPAEGIEGVKKLVVDTVFNSGGKPCPPIILGIGIGGNLEKSALLAKEALCRDFQKDSNNKDIAKLEHEILQLVNETGIGPMGLGGKTTCIGVNIKMFSCHIASLPVAINIQCHADRHKEVII